MKMSISRGVLELGAHFVGKLRDCYDLTSGVWMYGNTVEIHPANEVWCHALGVRAHLNSRSTETVAVLVIRKNGRRL